MTLVRAPAAFVWSLVLVTLPTLTVWLASSLIAFFGGPRELALVGGLLLFPVLPALLEWRATSSWKAKVAARRQFVGVPKRTLSTFTRLTLRTVAVCLAFQAGMVLAFPKTVFSALATRGDWFLDHTAEHEAYRSLVFGLANQLEALHTLANANPYDTAEDRSALSKIEVTASETTVISGSGARWRKLTNDERLSVEGAKGIPPVQPTGTGDGRLSAHGRTLTDGADTAPTEPGLVLSTGGTHWPWANQPSPVLEQLTPSDETSIEGVANFISQRERDPFRRVKALHDWVVTRLSYDHDSTKPGRRKPQDARSVFSGRQGVCEGYARLLVAFGKVTGDEIVYLTGDVREASGAAASVSHAWNAVRIEHAWYLVDTTWDDPTMVGDATPHYRTDYLFIPPNVAIWSHFPDDARWQLLQRRLDRGAFLRQPFARPSLARAGLVMRSPARASVDTGETMAVEIENPSRRWLHVLFRYYATERDCGISNDEVVSLTCTIPMSGEVIVFSNDDRYGTYEDAATITVTRR